MLLLLNKNQNKLNNIINENILTTEDVILIIRVFLSKTKRLLRIKDNAKSEKNIDKVISSYKPPIFWKDKNLVKTQIKLWSKENIQNLLVEITDTELLIKKNMEEEITITKKLYDKLQADSAFLACLEACGVDNWQGYEEAQEMFEQEN